MVFTGVMDIKWDICGGISSENVSSNVVVNVVNQRYILSVVGTGVHRGGMGERVERIAEAGLQWAAHTL